MHPPPAIVDLLEALVGDPDPTRLRAGLAVPTSGVLGLNGPAAIASAALAAEEVNATGGVRGRELELVLVDAGGAPTSVAREVAGLVASGAIEGLVGFHTSDVHRAVEAVTSRRVPYVFTPPHEGGRRLPGVMLLGESPTEQLLPVARSCISTAGRRRWALIGNDYIWPRAVHAAAAPLFARHGAQLEFVEEVPFGEVPVERLLDRLRSARVDAVLLSLVGRDLAVFNRAFAESPLAGSVVRVCGALDETGLLEIDGDGSGLLFTAMRWFATDPDTNGFAERYAHRYGALAPSLGVYAAGCYDGVHHLASTLAANRAERWGRPRTQPNGIRLTSGQTRLARADGVSFAPA